MNSDDVKIEPVLPGKSYHHGALHEALLKAAETILCREGLPGLTLRAIAREAGVSHGAPAHHFKDLADLLSELVASGFERLAAAMEAAAEAPPGGFAAIARAYASFAIGNAALFQLMFRVEKLNSRHERLRTARAAAFAIIAAASHLPPGTPTPEQMGALTAQFCMVHGFATLAANGRLGPLLRIALEGTQPSDLLNLALARLHGVGGG